MLGFLLGGATSALAGRKEALRHYKAAEVYYLSSRYDEALQELVLGYKEDPHPDFVYNMAKVLQKSGRPAQALRAYERYLEVAPEGRFREKAEERVRLLNEVGPAAEIPEPPPGASPQEQAMAHFRRAELYYRRGDYTQALGELGAGYERDSDPEFLFNIGKAHQKAGKYDRAVRAYKSYLQLAPRGRYADKAQQQIERLAPAPLQGEKGLELLRPPAPRLPREREPRPKWRLIGGALALGIGAGFVGYGAAGLALEGSCVSPVMAPQLRCDQIFDSYGLGIGLAVPGGVLMVGGITLMAMPGPYPEIHRSAESN